MVEVYPSVRELGRAAAGHAGDVIRAAIERRGKARIVVATGNSQVVMAECLVKEKLDWKRVEVFHMDEYVGIDEEDPASFRYWVRTRIEEKARPGVMHYLGDVESYTRLLHAAPIDLAFVGFGENGHIAFNDPHVADFGDPATVKRVSLDEKSRRQQVGEGHFDCLEDVPEEALTITCSGLYAAENWVCCVPEKRKAEAVKCALEGPISEKCPASLVQRHPNTRVYLDKDSAALLSAG